jgi:hypothetical protein
MEVAQDEVISRKRSIFHFPERRDKPAGCSE